MELKGRNLSLRMRGDDIALLHRELGLIGYKISMDEMEKKFFGKTTRLAVLNFQIKNKLKDTGVVNKTTALFLERIASKKKSYLEKYRHEPEIRQSFSLTFLAPEQLIKLSLMRLKLDKELVESEKKQKKKVLLHNKRVKR